MAEYVCKNGILRPITGIYQCKNSFQIEIWDTLKEKRIYNDGIPISINIDGTKTILSARALKDSSGLVNRHLFNMYVGNTYAANMDGWQNATFTQYTISSQGQQHLNSSNSVVEWEFYPEYSFVNGVQKNGKLTKILLRQYFTGNSNYMYYRRIFREGSYDFVPCKLLEEILPKFAYDNKPHYAEEVGWWNKITKKFHANPGGGVQNGLVETLTITD